MLYISDTIYYILNIFSCGNFNLKACIALRDPAEGWVDVHSFISSISW